MSTYKLNEEELKNVTGGENRWGCKPPSQAEVERAMQIWTKMENDYQIQVTTLDVNRDKEDVERLIKACGVTREELVNIVKVVGKKAPEAAPDKTITIKVE